MVGVLYISIYISIYTIYTYTRYIVYERCELRLGENFLQIFGQGKFRREPLRGVVIM